MPEPIAEATRILRERIRIRRLKLACSEEEVSRRSRPRLLSGYRRGPASRSIWNGTG